MDAPRRSRLRGYPRVPHTDVQQPARSRPGLVKPTTTPMTPPRATTGRDALRSGLAVEPRPHPDHHVGKEGRRPLEFLSVIKQISTQHPSSVTRTGSLRFHFRRADGFEVPESIVEALKDLVEGSSDLDSARKRRWFQALICKSGGYPRYDTSSLQRGTGDLRRHRSRVFWCRLRLDLHPKASVDRCVAVRFADTPPRPSGRTVTFTPVQLEVEPSVVRVASVVARWSDAAVEASSPTCRCR